MAGAEYAAWPLSCAKHLFGVAHACGMGPLRLLFSTCRLVSALKESEMPQASGRYPVQTQLALVATC